MSDPRHTVIISNRLPYPLTDGWKVRTFHIVRAIAQRGSTSLLVFHDGPEDELTAAEAALGSGIRIIAHPPPRGYTIANLIRGLVTRIPVHVWNQESEAMRRTLVRLGAELEFDLCVFVTTFMFRFLRDLPRGCRTVVDTHNVDSITFDRYARAMRNPVKRTYAAITARRLRQFEDRVYEAVDLTWVCSDNEHEEIRRRVPQATVDVVPNGVDTQRFAPDDATPPSGSRLLFFGKLDYFPNVDALEFLAAEVWPQVLANHPSAQLQIVGLDASPSVIALADRTPGFEWLGPVPDIRAALALADIVIVPLRVGGGTRLKVLEALAMAKPMVATTIGIEGIALQDGRDLLVADLPEEIAAAIGKLLGDPEDAHALGQRGRETVMAKYDWRAVAAQAHRSLARVDQG